MVKKAVNAKNKTAFWPRTSLKKIDQKCSCGHRPANFTIAKNQDSATKDLQVKKPKAWDLKSSVS